MALVTKAMKNQISTFFTNSLNETHRIVNTDLFSIVSIGGIDLCDDSHFRCTMKQALLQPAIEYAYWRRVVQAGKRTGLSYAPYPGRLVYANQPQIFPKLLRQFSFTIIQSTGMMAIIGPSHGIRPERRS